MRFFCSTEFRALSAALSIISHPKRLKTNTRKRRDRVHNLLPKNTNKRPRVVWESFVARATICSCTVRRNTRMNSRDVLVRSDKARSLCERTELHAVDAQQSGRRRRKLVPCNRADSKVTCRMSPSTTLSLTHTRTLRLAAESVFSVAVCRFVDLCRIVKLQNQRQAFSFAFVRVLSAAVS